MRLSTRSRYGVRLMLELALNYGRGNLDLKEVAKNEDISLKYLSQIVIPLRQARLVISQRGSRGGYTLSRRPEEVSLKDIVQVLEGDLALVECVRDGSSCRRASICVTQEIWAKLSRVIDDTLMTVTLADLVSRYNEKNCPAQTYDI